MNVPFGGTQSDPHHLSGWLGWWALQVTSWYTGLEGEAKVVLGNEFRRSISKGGERRGKENEGRGGGRRTRKRRRRGRRRRKDKEGGCGGKAALPQGEAGLQGCVKGRCAGELELRCSCRGGGSWGTGLCTSGSPSLPGRGVALDTRRAVAGASSLLPASSSAP